jgi:hypothetical protein
MGWSHTNLAVGGGEFQPDRKPNVIHVRFGLRLRYANWGSTGGGQNRSGLNPNKQR